LNWYETKRDGVAIRIHAQPGARRTEVVGLHGDCLKLHLASPPVEGKANACLIEFLARRLRVKRSQVTITRGTSSRRKTVFVAAAGVQPAALLDQEGEPA
jgi:uncharacterized protein